VKRSICTLIGVVALVGGTAAVATADTLIGTDTADVLQGTPNPDQLYGEAGDIA